MSLSILYKYTVDLDSKISWPLVSSFYFILAILTLIMVVEPKDVIQINESQNSKKEKNICYKIKKLTIDLFKSLKGNKEILICFILILAAVGP